MKTQFLVLLGHVLAALATAAIVPRSVSYDATSGTKVAVLDAAPVGIS